ncbi:MAG: restriction endonuclease subunit S, partial [Tissierellia bacterium]|nr:restriction endonuclease subunit S [Tissierellia bacterium]
RIDEKLELQQKRIEALKEQKKGMMQKIFSQEIRFKDDDGKDYPEWEEKKLGDVGEIITGGTPQTRKSDNFGDDYMWATPVDLGKTKYILNTNRRLSQLGLKSIKSINKGAILITCIGSTIGKLGISMAKMGTNQQINSIECKPDHNFEFLYYALLIDINMIIRYASTQAVPIINKTTLSKLKIPLPTLPEQTKIANFLSALDRRIELEEQKLQESKQFKKGLMQRMFI